MKEPQVPKATMTQGSVAAALLEKAYAVLFTVTPALSLLYATSWWGQAFEFMTINVMHLVISVQRTFCLIRFVKLLNGL